MDAVVPDLSELVYHHRTLLGLTQQELAERASVSRSTITNVEAGRIGGLRFSTVTRVLAALGLELSVTERRVVPNRSITADEAALRERFRSRFIKEGTNALFSSRE